MGVTGTNRNQRASRVVLLKTRLAAPIESPARCFQVHLFLEKSLSLSFSLSDCLSIHPSIYIYLSSSSSLIHHLLQRNSATNRKRIQ